MDNELQCCTTLMRTADKMGAQLRKSAPAEEVAKLQGLTEEYQRLWKDIKRRIRQYRKQWARETVSGLRSLKAIVKDAV